LAATLTISVQKTNAQVVVFQDDFSSNTIDPSKYQPDDRAFEWGTGDIHATAHDGVIQFVGTTTAQWWSGSALQLVPAFAAASDAPVKVSIDRLSEAGTGIGSRSALWILDQTKTQYVLFADNTEYSRWISWEYNRNIGVEGDNPRGSGVNIAAFDGGTFDDGLLHHMQIVANGSTVKLLLDGQQGAEVPFPFSTIFVEFGSYAAATGDTGNTTWDNLMVEVPEPAAYTFAAGLATLAFAAVHRMRKIRSQ
jgi:hypothetical protein